MVLIVAIAAVLTSICYTRYIRAINQDRAGQAALFDFGLLLMGSLSLQAWVADHHSFGLLVLYDGLSAIGTFIAVRCSSITLHRSDDAVKVCDSTHS